MKFRIPFVLTLLVGSLFISTLARAEGDNRENGGQHRREAPSRPAPPAFTAHPPGQHPHGPMVRPHAVRVLQPRVVAYGGRNWTHWHHPEFARPAYYWDYSIIHNVSCVAEDSYGDQYPVTEATFSGFALVNMSSIEDDALDRCYAESGSDPSCYLLTCSHF